MTEKDIEIYLRNLQQDEFDFKNQNNTLPVQEPEMAKRIISMFFSQISVYVRYLYDYCCLVILLKFNKSFWNNKQIVFTAKNLCTGINGDLEDCIVKRIFTNDIIFICHAKEYVIDKINNQRVYNIGGLVKLLSKLLFRKHSLMIRTFLFYKNSK